jgi:hypothetical protein
MQVEEDRVSIRVSDDENSSSATTWPGSSGCLWSGKPVLVGMRRLSPKVREDGQEGLSQKRDVTRKPEKTTAHRQILESPRQIHSQNTSDPRERVDHPLDPSLRVYHEKLIYARVCEHRRFGGVNEDIFCPDWLWVRLERPPRVAARTRHHRDSRKALPHKSAGAWTPACLALRRQGLDSEVLAAHQPNTAPRETRCILERSKHLPGCAVVPPEAQARARLDWRRCCPAEEVHGSHVACREEEQAPGSQGTSHAPRR